MKLKKYKSYLKNEAIDDVYDELFGRPSYDSEEDDDEIPSDDMENLLYLLRKLFKNSGVSVDISNKGLDIMIYAILNNKEKMDSILKLFDVVKKLKRDILPQYDSEFELWETKSGHPMMTFNFLYEGEDDDANDDGNAPF
jgi:uncharacterized protein YihD (DUF1040 family)